MNVLKLLQISIMASVAFLFTACGEQEASAPAAAPAASAPADSADASMDSGPSAIMSKIEKVDGVVYQDEIYSGWPYN